MFPTVSHACRKVQVNQLKQERWALAEQLAAGKQKADQVACEVMWEADEAVKAAEAPRWEAAEAEEAVAGARGQTAEAEEASGAVRQAPLSDCAEAASLQGLFADAMSHQQDASAQVGMQNTMTWHGPGQDHIFLWR